MQHSDDFVELRELVVWMDHHLDTAVADTYQGQPLAQDWARTAKVVEEAGEAIDALIGITGQNPRKGKYGLPSDLLDELADVALTGLYAIQHFTKNGDLTIDVLMKRARYHKARVEVSVDDANSDFWQSVAAKNLPTSGAPERSDLAYHEAHYDGREDD